MKLNKVITYPCSNLTIKALILGYRQVKMKLHLLKMKTKSIINLMNKNCKIIHWYYFKSVLMMSLIRKLLLLIQIFLGLLITKLTMKENLQICKFQTSLRSSIKLKIIKILRFKKNHNSLLHLKKFQIGMLCRKKEVAFSKR